MVAPRMTSIRVTAAANAGPMGPNARAIKMQPPTMNPVARRGSLRSMVRRKATRTAMRGMPTAATANANGKSIQRLKPDSR